LTQCSETAVKNLDGSADIKVSFYRQNRVAVKCYKCTELYSDRAVIRITSIKWPFTPPQTMETILPTDRDSERGVEEIGM